MAEYNLSVEMNLQKPSAANLAKVRQSLEDALGNIDLRITPGGAAKTKSEIQAIDKAIQSTNSSAKQLTVNLGSFQELLSRTIMITVLNKVVGAISNANREALRFESELAKLAQVTRKTTSEIKANSQELISISRTYNIASSKVAQLTRTLSQTGLSLREATKGAEILAKTSLLATFDSLSSTTEGFIAIMNTFQFTVQQTGDALEAINAISKRYAVESSDLVAAVVRTGGVFSTAGGQINELLAAITTVRSTTRESSETISTGFKTIFGRLQRPKTIQYFRDLGIELERGGKFIGPWEAIIKIGKDLESLNIRPGDLRFAEVVEQIGGIRQLSKVVPLLTRTATLERALADANNAEKESAEDLAKARETLAFKLGQLQKNFSSLINEMVSSDQFQFMAKGSISIANAVTEVTRALTAMKPLMPLLAFGVARGAFQFFSGGGGRGVKSLLGFNSGGLVPGVGDSDTVPAMLAPGEFVIRKRAVKAIGVESLSKINKYAQGGAVEGIPALLTPGEFVINQKSAQAYGYGKLNKINKYAQGGPVEVQRFSTGATGDGAKPKRKRRKGKSDWVQLDNPRQKVVDIGDVLEEGVYEATMRGFTRALGSATEKALMEPRKSRGGLLPPNKGESFEDYRERIIATAREKALPKRERAAISAKKKAQEAGFSGGNSPLLSDIEQMESSSKYFDMAKEKGGFTEKEAKRLRKKDPAGFGMFEKLSSEQGYDYGKKKGPEKKPKGGRDYLAMSFMMSSLAQLGKQYDENGKALDTFSNSMIDAVSQVSLFVGALSSAGVDFGGILSNTFERVGRLGGKSRGLVSAAAKNVPGVSRSGLFAKPVGSLAGGRLSKAGSRLASGARSVAGGISSAIADGTASSIAGSLLAAAAAAAVIGTTFKEIRKWTYDIAGAEKVRQKAIESGNEKVALSAVDDIVASRQFGSSAMNMSMAGGALGGGLAGFAIAGPLGAAVGAFVGGLAASADAISAWTSDSDYTLKKQTIAGAAVASTNRAIAKSNRQRADLEKQGNTDQIEQNSLDVIAAQRYSMAAVSDLEGQINKQEDSSIKALTFGLLGGATEEEKKALEALKKATEDSAGAFKQIEDDIIRQISTVQSQTGAVKTWGDALRAGGPVLAEYIKYLEQSDPKVAEEFKEALLSAAKTADVERAARIKAFNEFRAEQSIIRARFVIQSRLNDSMMMVVQSSDRLHESFSLMSKAVDFTARSSFSDERGSSISDITQIDNPRNMTRVLSMVNRLSNRTPGMGAAVSEIQRASAVQNQIAGAGGIADQIVSTMSQNIEVNEGELQAEVDDAAKRIASFASQKEIDNFKIRYGKLLKETGGATSQSDVQDLLEELFVRPIQPIADKAAETYRRQIDALNKFSEGLRSVSEIFDQVATKRVEAFSSSADFRASFNKIATGRTADPLQGRADDIERQRISLSTVGLGGLAGNTTGIGQTIRQLQGEIDQQNTIWEKFGATTKEDISLQEQRQRKIDLLNRALDSQIQSFGKLKEAALEVAAVEKEIAKQRQEELLGDIGKDPEALFKESQARVLAGRALSGNFDIRQLSSQFAMARGNMFGPEVFRQISEMQRLVMDQIGQIAQGTTPESAKASDLLAAIANQESLLRTQRDLGVAGGSVSALGRDAAQVFAQDQARIQERRSEDVTIGRRRTTSRGLAALSLAGRANQAEQAARNEEILNLSNQSAILIDHFKKMSVEVEHLTGLYGRMSGVLKGSPLTLDQRGPQGFIEGHQRAEQMRREIEARRQQQTIQIQEFQRQKRMKMMQGYNLGGVQASSAIRPAAPALGGMSNTFNADQLRMIQSALAPFVNAVQMLKRMPTTIDVAVNDVSVSVNHNGLEVFSQIETKVTEMITQSTAKALIDYDRNIHSGSVLAFS